MPGRLAYHFLDSVNVERKHSSMATVSEMQGVQNCEAVTSLPSELSKNHSNFLFTIHHFSLSNYSVSKILEEVNHIALSKLLVTTLSMEQKDGHCSPSLVVLSNNMDHLIKGT